MNITYREDKATQAAARLIKSEGGKVNVLKLVKLLYLADRTALINFGRPITFDWYVSMDHGPVLSFTLDRINGEKNDKGPSYWHSYISERSGHDISLIKETPNDQLSPAEEEILDYIYSEHGKKTQWDLRDLSHTLPEWRDPKGTSITIEIDDILSAEGFSAEEIREINDSFRAESFAHQTATEWMYSIRAGSTLLLSTPQVRQPHLWIILTDPEGRSSKVVAVMVRTKKSFTDDTVVLQSGDHPFIRHPTSVDYSSASYLTTSSIEQKIQDGRCHLKEELSKELLKHVRSGLLKSPRTVHAIRDYCQKRFKEK